MLLQNSLYVLFFALACRHVVKCLSLARRYIDDVHYRRKGTICRVYALLTFSIDHVIFFGVLRKFRYIDPLHRKQAIIDPEIVLRNELKKNLTKNLKKNNCCPHDSGISCCVSVIKHRELVNEVKWTTESRHVRYAFSQISPNRRNLIKTIIKSFNEISTDISAKSSRDMRTILSTRIVRDIKDATR